MNKPCEVAVVGHIYVDHILTGFTDWPRPGEELFTKEYVKEVGGGAAITACALSRLGRPTTLIGAVGTDEMPWLTRRLANFSVSTSGLLVGPGQTGVTIGISNQADRSFFTCAGENDRLEEELTSDSLLKRLSQNAHVHFAMPLSAPLVAHLLPSLHAAACTVSLDVGHQVTWLRDPANLSTCAAVDYLLPNELEATLISAGDSTAYLNFTQQHQWPHGVVKLGPRGAAMRIDNRNVRVDAPPMRVVDTTGAGDAFNAGFIDGLLDHASGVECLRRGCISGGMSTRFAGALDGLCTRSELQECYEQSYG